MSGVDAAGAEGSGDFPAGDGEGCEGGDPPGEPASDGGAATGGGAASATGTAGDEIPDASGAFESGRAPESGAEGCGGLRTRAIGSFWTTPRAGPSGIGPLSTDGHPSCEMKATRPRPMTTTTARMAIEVLRSRIRRPSPARLEPSTVSDSACRNLEATFTAIDDWDSPHEPASRKPQFCLEDSLRILNRRYRPRQLRRPPRG